MIVTDTSPLIAFERIGRLELLSQTLGQIVAPEAVVTEFGSRPSWLGVRPVRSTALVQLLRERVDEGEAEAIALATETDPSAVLLDERRARRVAQELGLPVLGSVGILLRAKRERRLATVRPVLDALLDTSFRLSDALRKEALRLAGEE